MSKQEGERFNGILDSQTEKFPSQKVQSKNSTADEYIVTESAVKILWQCKFFGRLDGSADVPLNILDICLRAGQKLLQWQKSYKLWEKPNFFFKKNSIFVRFDKSYHFSGILRKTKFSNSEPDTSVKSDIVNWQKRSTFSVLGEWLLFKIEIWAENIKSQWIQKQRWATLER